MSVLSNNNSPEKFLQLEPKLLLTTYDPCWTQDHWRDQVAAPGPPVSWLCLWGFDFTWFYSAIANQQQVNQMLICTNIFISGF